MNVASLELCKELYELSGLDMGNYVWLEPAKTPENAHPYISLRRNKPFKWDGAPKKLAPAYDLSDLLRKLPSTTDLDPDKWYEAFDTGLPDTWFIAKEMDTVGNHYRIQMQIEDEVLEPTIFEADTPENAAAKLLIELFRQGILSPEK